MPHSQRVTRGGTRSKLGEQLRLSLTTPRRMNEMSARIPMLAIALEAYYEAPELVETAEIFSIGLPDIDSYPVPTKSFWIRVAKQLIDGIAEGNNYALLSSLIEQLEVKNSLAIARTDWERRQANEALAPSIRELRESLGRVASPSAIVLPEATPFRAKAEIREMLATATTELLVVDPYIGVGTLDCFISVAQPVHLLTGDGPKSIEGGFERALSAFIAEGHVIDVRKAPMLHDRHLIFNDRCWLVGSSLKDAGKKAFNCLEIIDKAEIVAELRRKWSTAAVYP